MKTLNCLYFRKLRLALKLVKHRVVCTFEEFLVISSVLALVFGDVFVHLEDCEVGDEEDVAGQNCQEYKLKREACQVRLVEPRSVLVHQHGTRDADHYLKEDSMYEI